MIPDGLRRTLKQVVHREFRAVRLRAYALAVTLAWIAATIYYAAVRIAIGPPAPAGPLLIFAAALAGLLLALRKRPPTTVEAARLVDRRMGLKDRLATAVEFTGSDSRLIGWLMEDADQHARFVDPSKVAPFPPPLTRRGRWLLVAAVLCAGLWLLPLPSAVLSPSGQAFDPARDAAIVTDDEIFERIAALREQLAAQQSPEAIRLQRDLTQLQTGLRNRSLPKDEALALLQHLERRAGAQAVESAAAREAQGEVDLDRLQDLANRLVSAAGAAERGNVQAARDALSEARRIDPEALASNPELQRLLDELASGDPLQGLDDLMRAAEDLQNMINRSRNQSNLSEQENETGQGGDARTDGAAQAGNQGAGADGQPGEGTREAIESDEPVEGDPGGAGSQASGAGDGDGALRPGQGTGAEPGDQIGGDRPSDFESGNYPRALHFIPGQVLEGPLRFGTVQSNLTFDDGTGSGAGLSVQGRPGVSIDAEAVQREHLPLAYRESVRRYFQGLEPYR